MNRAVVVGAGIGGLASAVRIAHAGWQVRVFEARHEVGGRVGELRQEGYRFDTGPTLLMMLDPLERLFRDVGRRLEDYLDLTLLNPSYRVFFGDGTVFDSSPCIAQMIQQIRTKIHPDEVPGYLRLMSDLSAMYHAVVPAFVRNRYRTLWDLLSHDRIGLLVRYRLLARLWKRIPRYVRDPRLQMLFSFQTMYLGLSPQDALWVYGILTYMESGEGVWYPRGGMYRLPCALAEILQEEGGQIHLNSPVQEVLIEGGRTVGVRLQSGETIPADLVVLNVDVPTAYQRLLPPTRWARKRWKNSCSALMFYVGYEGRLPHQLHHNVYFSSDFEGNLDELFRQNRVPSDPSFYTCLSNRTDPTDAPEGCENLYVLVPVPNLTGESAQEHSEQVFRHIAQRVGLETDKIRFVRTFTPDDWATLGLWEGAAFGISHTFFQSTYFRPALATPFKGVYTVGASARPGNGIPMVLISAELLMEELRLRTK